MQMLETIRRKIESARDLHSVVKTMKALAAVNIHTYEKAVQAINSYHQNIETGLQIVLKKNSEMLKAPTAVHAELTGLIVFGAQRGMAGNFNLPNVNHIDHWINAEGLNRKSSLVICSVGERISEQLKDIRLSPNYTFDFPDFRYHLDSIIQDLLLIIETWRFQQNVFFIQLFYNRPVSSSSFKPFHFQLYPLDTIWLKELMEQKWPSRSIPLNTISAGELFYRIIRQYFYISLYRAFIESMASENASRLAAMQKAETNIEERLEKLDAQFNHQRQNAITEELLDIIAGFEALTN
jgi:F-type H+-transporting ATPase subunit gamma